MNGKNEINPASLMQMVYGFQRSRILLTAFELRIFTVIGDEKKSAAEVAGAIRAGTRAAERLMDALVAMGLLEKNAGRYANTEGAARFLVEGKPEFMSGFGHSVHLWDSWTTLTKAVRRGKTVRDRAPSESGDDWLVAFIAAMHYRASRRGRDIAKLLDLSGVTRLVDVGGGSGAFAMAFAKEKNDLHVTVFDLPNVLPLTRKYIAEAGLAAKVDTMPGNYMKDDLGGPYDMAFLSAIVHSNSDEENRLLIRKCAAALRAGGKIVIQDWIMSEDRTSPAAGAFFALNMLVNTEAGDTYTESEMRAWLSAAGFTDISRKDTEFDTSLLIASKE